MRLPPAWPGWTATAPALLATVEALLARGASANARWCDPDDRVHTLPVLYGAVARARSLPIVERLLAAGADPNDHESLYHAAEHPGGPMLAALVGAGARWDRHQRPCSASSTTTTCRAWPKPWPLRADPNEAGPGGRRALHHALWRGRGAESVRLLLAHGADPRATDDLGLAAAAYALRSGARDALALLQDKGAPALAPQEAFAAACAAGDEAAARSHLAAQPDAVKSLPPPPAAPAAGTGAARPPRGRGIDAVARLAGRGDRRLGRQRAEPGRLPG
jgi:hypothetical protein